MLLGTPVTTVKQVYTSTLKPEQLNVTEPIHTYTHTVTVDDGLMFNCIQVAGFFCV